MARMALLTGLVLTVLTQGDMAFAMSPGPVARPNRALQQGWLAVRALTRVGLQQYDLARADLDDLLWVAPTAWAHAARGWVHAQQGRDRRSQADLDEAFRLAPRSTWLYLVRAQLALGRQDTDQAVRDANRAVQQAGDNPWPYFVRATFLASQGDHAAALADSEQALEIGGPVRCFRARLFLELGYPHQAMVELDTAGQDGEDGAEFRLMHALALSKQGHLDAALADCESALRWDPGHARAYAARAFLHFQRKDLERALADIARAIELDPKQAHFYQQRAAYVLTQGGEKVRALEDLHKAEDLGLVDPELLRLRGEIHAALGEFPHALADTDRAVRLAPQSSAVYLSRGRVQHAMGDIERWCDDCRTAVKLAPEWAEANRELTLASAQVRDWPTVIRSSAHVLRANPSDDDVRTVRAQSLLFHGSYGHAIGEFTYLIKKVPTEEQAALRASRACAFFSQGDYVAGGVDCLLAFLIKPEVTVPVVASNWLYRAFLSSARRRGH